MVMSLATVVMTFRPVPRNHCETLGANHIWNVPRQRSPIADLERRMLDLIWLKNVSATDFDSADDYDGDLDEHHSSDVEERVEAVPV